MRPRVRVRPRREIISGKYGEIVDIVWRFSMDDLHEVWEIQRSRAPARKRQPQFERSSSSSRGSSISSTSSSKGSLLLSLLRDERCRQELRCFLQGEFASEGLEFWEAVENLRTTATIGSAKMIFKKFIAEGAPFQVNISSSLRRETESDYASYLENVRGSTTPFDKVQFEVVRALELDALDRFLSTPAGRLSLLVLEADGGPLLAGTVAKHKYGGVWVHRHCELHVDGIVFFNKRLRATSSIPAESLIDVIQDDDARLYAFHLRLDYKKTVTIAVESPEDRERWTRSLLRLIDAYPVAADVLDSLEDHDDDSGLCYPRSPSSRSRRRRRRRSLRTMFRSATTFLFNRLRPTREKDEPLRRSFTEVVPRPSEESPKFKESEDQKPSFRPSGELLRETIVVEICDTDTESKTDPETTRTRLGVLCRALRPALLQEWWRQNVKQLDDNNTKRRRSPTSLLRSSSLSSLPKESSTVTFDPRLSAVPSLFWLVCAAKHGAANAACEEDDSRDDARRTLTLIKALAVELEAAVRLRVRARQLWSKLRWNLRKATRHHRDVSFPRQLREIATSSVQQFLNVTYFVDALRHSHGSVHDGPGTGGSVTPRPPRRTKKKAPLATLTKHRLRDVLLAEHLVSDDDDAWANLDSVLGETRCALCDGPVDKRLVVVNRVEKRLRWVHVDCGGRTFACDLPPSTPVGCPVCDDDDPVTARCSLRPSTSSEAIRVTAGHSSLEVAIPSTSPEAIRIAFVPDDSSTKKQHYATAVLVNKDTTSTTLMNVEIATQ